MDLSRKGTNFYSENVENSYLCAMKLEKKDKTLNQSLRIDVGDTIKSRLPRYYRFIPNPVIKWLERTICQDDLNGILQRTQGKNGVKFCEAALKDLGVTYSTLGEHPDKSNRRVIIVSNHPLGALDGIILIAWASRYFGCHIKFLVNDLLMAIKPLDDVFLPINKHGKQSRASSEGIDNFLAGDEPIIIFPAGLVSRKHKDGIYDLKWQKMFVNKAIQYQRDIIPVYFDGLNSSFFYNFAKARTKIGLKFNIEMIYLPREIFQSKNTHFNLTVGKTISWKQLKGGSRAYLEAKAIKKIVYNLKQN